jgi:hypothetical protein
MSYKDFEIKVNEEDLNKKNVLYSWLIKLNDKDYTYYGISTRSLEVRTKEHLRSNDSKFDKFLTKNKKDIQSIELKVEKEYKRNFKDMKSRLEKIESQRILKGKLEDLFNLNTKTC